MLFKLFKNGRFYLWFVAILLAVFFFWKQEVFWFKRFPTDMAIENQKVWTLHYVNKKEISDTIVGITYASVQYWNNELSTYIWDVKVDNISDLLKFTQKLKMNSKISINSLLKHTSDRKVALTLYQKSINKLISQSKGIIPSLKNFIQQHEMKYRFCESWKQAADSLYSRWVSNWQEWYAEWWYKDAKEHWACMTEERIVINAYTPLLDNINIYYQKLLLQQKFVENNFTLLVSNYQLLEWENLENIMRVKQELGE